MALRIVQSSKQHGRPIINACCTEARIGAIPATLIELTLPFLGAEEIVSLSAACTAHYALLTAQRLRLLYVQELERLSDKRNSSYGRAQSWQHSQIWSCIDLMH
jgi:hypothetical protein